MAKVDLDLVKMVLQRNKIDAVKTAVIIEDIAMESKAAQANDDKEAPVKKQSVILVSSPDGLIDPKKADLTGWVVKIPEDKSVYELVDNLHKSACDFNVSPKGRNWPVKTIAELCEFGSSKILKENNLWVSTKEPVCVIFVKNSIKFDA